VSDEAARRTRERVRHVFDEWARQGRAEGMEAGHGFAARVGFERLELPAGGHYLDVGCGNGYSVRWAAEVVGPEGHAVGLDLSAEMVARARKRSGGLPNVYFEQSAFPEHGLPRGAFDAVLSMEVLYYVPDLLGALQEVHRLLRPGGRFACLVDYYRENEASHDWPADLDCEMTLLSMAGWREAFLSADLEVLEQQCVLQPLPPGESPTWKHTQGTLLTLATRPA
jgi:ubiquinone/menaquinone biosynthesis C-methylase UbiE